MVTWHIVDDDVECLHIERNPTMTCSGSHLYKFYRFKTSMIGRHEHGPKKQDPDTVRHDIVPVPVL
jgi:hypothetical protein